METIRRLAGVVFGPDRFMGALKGKQPQLLVPFTVFCVGVVLNLAAQSIAFRAISSSLPATIAVEEQHWNRLGFTLSLVSQGVGGVLFWFVGTGILFCLAILMDGEGEYRKLLEATGYAHVPFVIFSVVALALTITYKPALNLHSGANITPEMIQVAIRTEVSGGRLLLLKGLNTACYLWISLLCVMGLHHLCRLAYKRCVVCFVVLVGLVFAIEYMKRRLLQI
ncbi:MAG: Yip1 family protein [Planctomycetota bacterium]|nr:Yip1 family protein [Planctomycetota bacterium]